MPNHVTTIIQTTPEVADALTHNGEVDFERIIPSPPNKERDDCPHGSGRSSEPDENGVVCWYAWNIEHWGTKWNAYESSVNGTNGDQAEIRFETAWSHPLPVLTALSERFPTAVISVRYADEDLGYNLGQYTIEAGVIVSNRDFETGSPEALDFAAQIKYGQSYAEVISDDLDD